MTKLLSDIAEVCMGYTLRSSIEGFESGDLSVVRAKDITTKGEIDISQLPQVAIRGFKGSAFVKEGDVLLSCRGSFRAAACGKTEEGVVASSTVFIIRPKSSEILSEYLAVFLNSPQGQSRLGKLSSGGAMKSLIRRDVVHLEVDIPSLDIQQKIVDAYRIWVKLDSFLERKRDLYYNLSQLLIS